MTRVFLVLSVLILATVLILAGARIPVTDWIELIRLHVQSLGGYGIIVFVILYSLVSLFMIPVLPLTLVAGLVYGIWGFPLVLLSATIAACIAFLLARYFLHARVSAMIDNKVIVVALKRAVTKEGWKIVILLRMSLVLSFAMQNYLLALTDIRFWPYAVASAVGMTPAIALYVYLGSLGSIANGGWLQRGMLVAGLAATIVALVLISRRTKQMIDQLKSEYQGE